MRNHTAVEVSTLPTCDLCVTPPIRPAAYDAKTTHGPWANLCEEHYAEIGIGLGLGKGQRYIVKSPTDDSPMAGGQRGLDWTAPMAIGDDR